jgi:3',5'-cyclic AMP phosphodiesterase CpdA
MITGDLAKRMGETYDYPAIKTILEPAVNADITPRLILGNHDDREHLLKVFPASTPLPVPGKFTQILHMDSANWFLLDSQQRPNHTPGRLGPAQLDWLKQELDAAPGKPAIVLLHHDFPTVPEGQHTTGLEDADEFLAILRPRRQVKACIYGHTHRYSIETDPSGFHRINLPAVAYSFTEAPVGWVLARIRDNGIRLELRTLDPRHRDNGSVTQLRWRTATAQPAPELSKSRA